MNSRVIPRSNAWAALSGLIAAGAALATGELMSGISASIPSLIVGIAEVVTAEAPGSVVRWSINTFGTNQKTLLIWGITLSSLTVGSLIGIAALKKRILAAISFLGFGVLGGWAAARASLSSNPWSWFSSLLSATLGLIALLTLLDKLPFGKTIYNQDKCLDSRERRFFLNTAGITAFWTIFGTGLGYFLRKGQSVEEARQQLATELDTSLNLSPSASATNSEIFDVIDGISPIITPNDDFYLIDTAIRKPQVNPESWSLKITGMVDKELKIHFSDLLEMDKIEETITLSCVSNEVGGSLIGNAKWGGVPLIAVLDMAGVQPGATQIVGRSVDGWTGGFPTEIVMEGRPAIIAVTMNGEPLPVAHGFPARLVVAGLYGYVSATKWLSEIELTTWEEFNGYWIPRGWDKEGPVKTQSRIDVPKNGAILPAGQTVIAGVAWAGHRSVDAVEVRVDSGAWIPASLSGELSESSWRQWVVEYQAAPGDHRIEVRATDGKGVTQTSNRSQPAPNGATGWHNVNFRSQGP